MGRLISLAECWGLCSQRRVVVLNTIYCRRQHICCWFRYLSYFLLFIVEACLSLVICLLLFTTGLLRRKCPINCGFGGMCYHIKVPRVSSHLCACVTLCEGFGPAVLNHFPQLNVLHETLHVCMWWKERERERLKVSVRQTLCVLHVLWL